MQGTVAKTKQYDVEQDMAHSNNMALSMLHVDMFKQLRQKSNETARYGEMCLIGPH